MAEIAAPAATPATMPRAHAALVNVLAFMACQVIRDDRWPLMMADLRDVQAACQPVPVPLFQKLEAAGWAVLAAEPASRTTAGAAIWVKVMLDARAVLADFFYWRGAAAAEPFRRLAEGDRDDAGA